MTPVWNQCCSGGCWEQNHSTASMTDVYSWAVQFSFLCISRHGVDSSIRSVTSSHLWPPPVLEAGGCELQALLWWQHFTCGPLSLQRLYPKSVLWCKGKEAAVSMAPALLLLGQPSMPGHPTTPTSHLAVTNPSRLFLQKFPMTSFSIKLTLWCMWSQGENRKTGYPFRECFFVRLVAVFNSSCVACHQNRNCSDDERLVPDEIVTGDTCSSDLVFGMCEGEKSVLVGSFIHSAFKN